MSTAKRKKRSSSLKGSLNPSKRHRDRFNIELDNLAKLLPFPHDVIQKLDKLSILRLSASYLRAKNFFKGQQWTEESKVGKLSDGPPDFEGNGIFSKLLLDALDGFVIVLTREFEVFYASETVQDYLGLAQASVIHQDFLRFIHVDDHDLIRKNLLPFPEDEEEQKIRILDEENDGIASETGSTCGSDEEGKDVETERSFVCRMKCILNTSAGFFKPFRCSGRLREMTLPDCERRDYGLFMICTPLETVSSSVLEIRLKTSLFCTKNRMDLSFMDIDQKGRSLLGYHKRDIALQSSYCMIHFDDIPVLKTLHGDLMSTGKCQGTFRMLNKNLKWQWLTGTAQVVFKGAEPDFIITTNRPLSEEEGEEILRQRGQFPALPFTASDSGSPSPRTPQSPGSISNYSNGGSPLGVPWGDFSATADFKYPTMPASHKYSSSNGRLKRKPNVPDGFVKSPASDLTLDDLHLEPLDNNGNGGDLLQGMDPPTYEEALLLATDCLTIAGNNDNNSLTSPDGSQPSLSQSSPKNLEHFSPNAPMGPSPYPSPAGHPPHHLSPGGLPTPDPSPVGHCNTAPARVNISWEGMGQMKVSKPLQAPPPQMQSKSALISTTIKKKERQEMYGPSCITGQQPPNPMVSPRGMQPGPQGNWMHANQVPQAPRNIQQQQYPDWKTQQHTIQQNGMQNFAGQRSATVMGSENAVYATNMQGGKWDLNVPPLFEDTLPSLEYDGGLGYPRTATQQNVGGTGHLQHHGWDPQVDILSPPYHQEDYHSGFGFQGNPLPANSQGQTTLGWG